MYKALYRLFGGFVADVVAAIEQVNQCQSRVAVIERELVLIFISVVLR